MKTEKQIERDFYSLISQSSLGAAIRGTIYRSEMRPRDAESEDIIIKFLSGLDGQIQQGVVILNVYVPDITMRSDGRKVEDKQRVAELEELIVDFIENNGSTEYLIESDLTPTSMLNEELEQHLIYARLRFQRLSD
ncbi:MAG: hypothetical protein IKP11_04525 [Paludibacteraceae bacterium]|nr:hypothetical protein [Paludibacteraceae bacterium]